MVFSARSPLALLLAALLGAAGCGTPPAPAAPVAEAPPAAVPVPTDPLLRAALDETRAAAADFEALFRPSDAPAGAAGPLPATLPAARFAGAQAAAERAAHAAGRADSLLVALAARAPLGEAAADLRAALDIAPGLAHDLLEVEEHGPLPETFDPRPMQAQFDAYAGYLRSLADRAATEAAR